MKSHFRMPPVLDDCNGQPRGAGIEFELGNLSISQVADALQKALGGSQQKQSPFEIYLQDTRLGKIKIERDTRFLTSLQYREWLSMLGIDFSPGAEGEKFEEEVDKLSRWLIPCEIVTQPIIFEDLITLNEMVNVLDNLGAEGTHESLYYAFGLHINASVPDWESQTLLAYLQSFLLLADWIIEDAQTDVTRRYFTKFIDPFPPDYVELILQSSYQPDIHQLMSDYLQHNPTRNRPLDMLPVFCMLDQNLVLKAVRKEEKQLIKGRPAFHYRLPDCRLGMKGWSVAAEWNRWQLVEVIANDHALRKRLITAWNKEMASFFSISHKSNWIEQMDQVVKDIRRV